MKWRRTKSSKTYPWIRKQRSKNHIESVTKWNALHVSRNVVFSTEETEDLFEFDAEGELEDSSKQRFWKQVSNQDNMLLDTIQSFYSDCVSHGGKLLIIWFRVNKRRQIEISLEENSVTGSGAGEESQEPGGQPQAPPPTPYGTPHSSAIVKHNLDNLTRRLEKMWITKILNPFYRRTTVKNQSFMMCKQKIRI